MGQVSDGTADVTNGSATVVASPFTDWTDVQLAMQQGVIPFFSLLGNTEIPQQIIATAAPTVSSSGNWELTLYQPWQGSTLSAQPYTIHKDFTPNVKLAIPSGGDKQWAQMYARNVTIIDYMLGQGAIFETAPVAGDITFNIPNGRTLYITDELDIPIGVEVDILAGGDLEIG